MKRYTDEDYKKLFEQNKAFYEQKKQERILKEVAEEMDSFSIEYERPTKFMFLNFDPDKLTIELIFKNAKNFILKTLNYIYIKEKISGNDLYNYLFSSQSWKELEDTGLPSKEELQEIDFKRPVLMARIENPDITIEEILNILEKFLNSEEYKSYKELFDFNTLYRFIFGTKPMFFYEQNKDSNII